MKVAVIGGGFTGIAVAWQLIQCRGVTVDLFDAKGIGGGASGIAAGLLHPYAGEQGRRSWMASEGMKATMELLHVAEMALGKPVADYSGILKKGDLEQIYEDVIEISKNYYTISSGITVFSSLYLQGLWLSCSEKGVKLHLKSITDLEELKDYDKVILAAGPGIFAFKEFKHLRLGKTKGQVLVCANRGQMIEKSIVGKGYIAKSEDPYTFYVGSTYERGNSLSEEPCLETALADLRAKAAVLSPDVCPLNVLECRAGMRVSRVGHYIPLLEVVMDRFYAITGMGSRGLLYHALYAKMLKDRIVT